MAAAEDTNSTQNPSGSDAPKLSDLLDRGWKLYDEVDTTHESSSSTAVQVKVKRAIVQLEEATRMVNQLNLFRLDRTTHTYTHSRTRSDHFKCSFYNQCCCQSTTSERRADYDGSYFSSSHPLQIKRVNVLFSFTVQY